MIAFDPMEGIPSRKNKAKLHKPFDEIQIKKLINKNLTY